MIFTTKIKKIILLKLMTSLNNSQKWNLVNNNFLSEGMYKINNGDKIELLLINKTSSDVIESFNYKLAYDLSKTNLEDNVQITTWSKIQNDTKNIYRCSKDNYGFCSNGKLLCISNNQCDNYVSEWSCQKLGSVLNPTLKKDDKILLTENTITSLDSNKTKTKNPIVFQSIEEYLTTNNTDLDPNLSSIWNQLKLNLSAGEYTLTGTQNAYVKSSGLNVSRQKNGSVIGGGQQITINDADNEIVLEGLSIYQSNSETSDKDVLNLFYKMVFRKLDDGYINFVYVDSLDSVGYGYVDSFLGKEIRIVGLSYEDYSLNIGETLNFTLSVNENNLNFVFNDTSLLSGYTRNIYFTKLEKPAITCPVESAPEICSSIPQCPSACPPTSCDPCDSWFNINSLGYICIGAMFGVVYLF